MMAEKEVYRHISMTPEVNPQGIRVFLPQLSAIDTDVGTASITYTDRLDRPSNISETRIADEVSSCRCRGSLYSCHIPYPSIGKPADSPPCQQSLRKFLGDNVRWREKATACQPIAMSDEAIAETPQSSFRRKAWVEDDAVADEPQSSGGKCSPPCLFHCIPPDNSLDETCQCHRGRMTSSTGRLPIQFPAAGTNANKIATRDESLVSNLYSFSERHQCADGTREECCCGRFLQKDEPASPTAWATPVASTSAEAVTAPVYGSRYSKLAVSRAAMEAWEAAETWAWTIAEATSSTISGGEKFSPEARSVCDDAQVLASRVIESSEGHCVANVKDLAESGCCCSLTDRIPRSTFPTRDGLPHCSPARGDVIRAAKCFCVVDRVIPILSHQYSLGISHNAVNAAIKAPLAEETLEEGKHISMKTISFGRMGMVNAAAARVLGRLEHGEKAWRKNAQCAGFRAFQAHLLKIVQRRRKGAIAVKHCKRGYMAQGWRSMKAQIRRKSRSGGIFNAAAAAGEAAISTTDRFIRARRIRRVIAMFRRNWQARMALRSRDDLADLHFAEWRVPQTVEIWRKLPQTKRSCNKSSNLAIYTWRLNLLSLALARWAIYSLGDGERRQRLLVWRGALSSEKRPPVTKFEPSLSGNYRHFGVFQRDSRDNVEESRQWQYTQCNDGLLWKKASSLPPPILSTMTTGAGSTACITRPIYITGDTEERIAVAETRSGGTAAMPLVGFAERFELGAGWELQDNTKKGEYTRDVCVNGECEDAESSTMDSAVEALSGRHAVTPRKYLCPGHSFVDEPEAINSSSGNQSERVTDDAYAGELNGKQNVLRESLWKTIVNAEDPRWVSRSNENQSTALKSGSSSKSMYRVGSCSVRSDRKSALLVHETGGEVEYNTFKPTERRLKNISSPPFTKTKSVAKEVTTPDDGTVRQPHLEGNPASCRIELWESTSEKSHMVSRGTATVGLLGGRPETEAAKGVTKKVIAKSASVGIEENDGRCLDGESGELEVGGESEAIARASCVRQILTRIAPMAAAPEGGITSTALSKEGANPSSSQENAPGLSKIPGSFCDKQNVVGFYKEAKAGGTRCGSAAASQEEGEMLKPSPTPEGTIRERQYFAQASQEMPDKAEVVVTDGVVATSLVECGTRIQPPDELVVLVQAGAISTPSPTSASVSQCLGEAAATELSQFSLTVLPSGTTTSTGGNTESLGGRNASLCLQQGLIDSVENPMTGGDDRDNGHRSGVTEGVAESKRYPSVVTDTGAWPFSTVSAFHAEALFSKSKGLKSQVLEETEGGLSAQHATVKDMGETAIDSIYAVGATSASAILSFPRGRGHDVNVAVKGTEMGGVCKPPHSLFSLGGDLKCSSAEQRKSSFSHMLSSDRSCNDSSIVEPKQVLSETINRKFPDHLRPFLTPPEQQVLQRDPRPAGLLSSSSAELMAALTPVEPETTTEKSALLPELAVSVRGIPVQRQGRESVNNLPSPTSSEIHNVKLGVVLAFPVSTQAPMSDLSSISWYERGDEELSRQCCRSSQPIERNTARREFDGDFVVQKLSPHGLSSITSLSSVLSPPVVPSDVDPTMGSRRNSNLGLSSNGHDRSEVEEAAVSPLLPDPTLSTYPQAIAFAPVPAAETRYEEPRLCHIESRRTPLNSAGVVRAQSDMLSPSVSVRAPLSDTSSISWPECVGDEISRRSCRSFQLTEESIFSRGLGDDVGSRNLLVCGPPFSALLRPVLPPPVMPANADTLTVSGQGSSSPPSSNEQLSSVQEEASVSPLPSNSTLPASPQVAMFFPTPAADILHGEPKSRRDESRRTFPDDTGSFRPRSDGWEPRKNIWPPLLGCPNPVGRQKNYLDATSFVSPQSMVTHTEKEKGSGVAATANRQASAPDLSFSACSGSCVDFAGPSDQPNMYQSLADLPAIVDIRQGSTSSHIVSDRGRYSAQLSANEGELRRTSVPVLPSLPDGGGGQHEINKPIAAVSMGRDSAKSGFTSNRKSVEDGVKMKDDLQETLIAYALPDPVRRGTPDLPPDYFRKILRPSQNLSPPGSATPLSYGTVQIAHHSKSRTSTTEGVRVSHLRRPSPNAEAHFQALPEKLLSCPKYNKYHASRKSKNRSYGRRGGDGERGVPRSSSSYGKKTEASGWKGRVPLEEQVSQAFWQHHRILAGLRKWHLWLRTSITHRRVDTALAARVSTIYERKALGKWRTAHTNLVSRKTGAEARQTRLHKFFRLGGALSTVNIATAIASLRRWHRSSVSKTRLKLSLSAWATRVREFRAVDQHRCHALVKRGLSIWQRDVQYAGLAKTRRLTNALFMLRALARRRLYAWQQRRKRRTDSRKVADKYRTGVGAEPAAQRLQWRSERLRVENALRFLGDTARRRMVLRKQCRGVVTRVEHLHVRKALRIWGKTARGGIESRKNHQAAMVRVECSRVQKALRAWGNKARKKAVSCKKRRAVVMRVENCFRMNAIKSWQISTKYRRPRQRLLSRGQAHHARHLVREGLLGLWHATKNTRAYRYALDVGKVHWRQLGAMLIGGTLWDFVKSRRHVFERVDKDRLRVAGIAGFNRWRQVTRSERVAESARITGDAWLLIRMRRVGLSALADVSARWASHSRQFQAARQQFSRRCASSAVSLWRVWTRHHAASAELHAAAGAMHRTWTASAGLRALDRKARARMARREAAQMAEQYLLRTPGLERWRLQTVARRHARGQKRVATVHWAKKLSSKVLLSWEAAALQQWAGSRQEEAAEEYECNACKKRALKAWLEFAVRSAKQRQRLKCYGEAHTLGWN